MTTHAALITEIQKRCDAATPGPWVSDGSTINDITIWSRGYNAKLLEKHLGEEVTIPQDVVVADVGWPMAQITDEDGNMTEPDPQELANGQFIAHSRDDIPFLLAEITDLREQVRRRDDALDKAKFTLEFVLAYREDNGRLLRGYLSDNDVEETLAAIREAREGRDAQ